MILQVDSITPHGAVSADWALTIVVTLLGTIILIMSGLVVRYLQSTLTEIKQTQIDHNERMDKMDKTDDDLRLRVILMEREKDLQSVRLADEIVNKIRSITPRII